MLSIVDDNEKPQSDRSGVSLFRFGTVAYAVGKESALIQAV